MKKMNKGWAKYFKRFGVFALMLLLFAMPMTAMAAETSPDIDVFGNAEYEFDPKAAGQEVAPNTKIMIYLSPDEAFTGGEILFDTESMFYQLPKEGLSYQLLNPKDGKLTISIYRGSEDKIYDLTGTVTLDNTAKKVNVVWDKNSPGYQFLAQVTNAEYELGVMATVDGSSDKFTLEGGETYYVDNTGDATFTKNVDMDVSPDSMTEAQKAEFQFTATMQQATVGADGKPERDADGYIVYTNKTRTFTLNNMTKDGNGKWKIEFENIKPGSNVTVEETSHAEFAGYTYDAGQAEEARIEGIAPFVTSQSCSLHNNYTQDTGSLKMTKSFSDSDLPAFQAAQAKNVKVLVYPKGATEAIAEVTFDKATYNGDNKQYTYTFESLPVGEYTVKEVAVVGDYEWTLGTYQIGNGNVVSVDTSNGAIQTGNGEVGIAKDQTQTIALTNTYKRDLGNLTLDKKFDGADLTPEQKKQVKFTVKMDGKYVWLKKEGDSYKFVTLTDTETQPEGADTYTFTYDMISSGAVSMTDMPTGKYTIVESNADFDGYTRVTEYQIGSDGFKQVNDNQFTANVGKNQITNATVKNTYKQNGKLTVKKTFTGRTPSGNEEESITFKLQRQNSQGDWADVDGSTKTYAEVKNGGFTWTGLEFGTYRVVESGADLDPTRYSVVTTYVVSGSDSSKTGTMTDAISVGATTSDTVEYTNTYTRLTTDLQISKTIEGTYPKEGSDDREELKAQLGFVVKKNNVALTWREENGKFVYDPDGTVSEIPYSKLDYQLTGLPAGDTYTIEEVNATLGGYVLYAETSQEHNAVHGTPGTVSFTNTYSPEAGLKISKSFTGDLGNAYCNEKILNKLEFKVYYVENGETVYVNNQEIYTFTELSSGNGLKIPADKEIFIEEVSGDPNENLSGIFDITTTSSVTVGDNASVSGNNIAKVFVNPGDLIAVAFNNDYKQKNEFEVVGTPFIKVNHHKTWSGLDEDGKCNDDEGEAVKDAVRITLELYSEKDHKYHLWKEYKWEDFNAEVTGNKVIALPAGKYRLTETNAHVDGYQRKAILTVGDFVELKEMTQDPKKPGTSYYEFTIPEDKAGTQLKLSLANVYEPLGDLTIRKTIDSSGNLTELTDAQKAAIKFELFRRDGDKDTKIGNTITYADEKFTDGTYTFVDLPIGVYEIQGSNHVLRRYRYVVKESGYIDGYNCETIVTVEMTHGDDEATNNQEKTGIVNLQPGSDNPATIAFKNKYVRQKGALTIEKEFEGLPDNKIPGVSFSIKSGNNIIKWNNGENGSHVYDENGAVSSFGFADMQPVNGSDTDAQAGSYTISGLPTGTYTVVETNANVDDYIRTTEIAVTNAEGETTNTTPTQNGTSEQDVSSGVTITNDGNSVVKFENTYTEIGSLKLKKSFTYVGESSLTDAQRQGIKFTLKKGDATIREITLGGMAKNGEDFEYTFENLPTGDDYVLVESNADYSGYTRKTTFTVGGVKGSTTTNVETSESYDEKKPFAGVSIAQGEVQTAEVVNDYEEKGDLKIQKSYVGLPEKPDLSKIYFVVEHNGKILPDNDDKFYEKDGVKLGTISGDDLFGESFYTLKDLPAGEYTVKEVVIGESNDIADTDSTYYGYVHKTTTVKVGKGEPQVTTHGSGAIGDVSAEGKISAGETTFLFTNTYEQVPHITATKTGGEESQNTVNGLPVWAFVAEFSNISSENTIDGEFRFTDVFDTDYPHLFKICNAEGYQPVAAGAEIMSIDETTDGQAVFTLKLNEDNADKKVSVTYYLQPEDENALRTLLADEGEVKKSTVNGLLKTWTFTNKFTYQVIPTGETKEATKNYFYQLSPITKEAQTETGSSRVTFKLNVNPDAAWIGSGSELVITDTMTPNIAVDLSTLDVSPAEEKGNVTASQPVDIETPDGSMKQMQIRIPNGKRLEITYTARIIGQNTQSLKNTAKFLGVSDTEENEVVLNQTGSGTASLACIRLLKYGHTTTMGIAGAEFQLQAVGEDGVATKIVGTYTTDADGKLFIEGGIDWETRYRFVETKAPDGYVINPEPIYFRLYNPYDPAHEDTANHTEAVIYGSTLMHNNEPLRTQVVLEAQKTLAGRELQAEEFSFELYEIGKDGSRTLLQTVSNAEDGSVSFNAIEYSYNEFRKEDGSYEPELTKEYVIAEKNSNAGGVTYDQNEYRVNVTLKLSEDKKSLEAEVKYLEADGSELPDGITFANSYSANGSVKPEGSKELNGATVMRDAFSFVISGAGTDITVATTADNSTDPENFVNTQAIPYPRFQYVVNPAAQKVGYAYDDTTKVVTLTVKEYKGFEVYDAPHLDPESGYDYAFLYTIKENVPGDEDCYAYDKSEYSYVVSIRDNGAGALVTSAQLKKDGTTAEAADFINAYYGSLMIKKNVTMGDEDTDSNLLDGTYTFKVYTDESCETQATDRNDKPVSAELRISGGKSQERTIDGLVPGTYWVKEEVAEGAVALPKDNPVEVGVSGDKIAEVPTAVFTNNCSVGNLELTKTVTGTQDATKEFTFTITIESVAKKSFQARLSTADADKTVVFDADGKATVTLKAGESILIKDLPHGAAYTVAETDLPDGYTAGELTDATGTISGAETIELTRTNIYTMIGEAELKATKSVTGNEYTANEDFTFTLAAVDAAHHPDGAQTLPEPLTRTVTSGNEVSWEISYTQPGTYRYTITETKGTTPGMAYDETAHTVEVVVTDNGDGNLSTAVTYDGEAQKNGLTITNRYSETSFAPEVTKKVVDKDAPKETFNFKLKSKGLTDEYTDTASCESDKTATFREITYHEPGTYVYEITEIAGTTEGMTYSKQTVTCTVEVKENAETGELNATAYYSGGGDKGNEFTNEYTKPVGSAVLQVTKRIDGNEYTGNEKFAFTLAKTATNTSVIKDPLTQSIAKDETATWTIEYDEPGTYYYTIQETKGNTAGMHYDTKTYYAKVVVEYDYENDPADAVLKATVTYGDSQQAEDSSLVVTNNYTMATFAPEVQKVVEGDAPEGLTFDFVLKDKDGNTIETKENVSAGGVTFSEITYYEPGVYEYTINEIIPEELEDRVPGMTYFTQTITCKVDVSVGEDSNELVVSAEYTNDDGEAKNTITNKYEKPKGEAELAVRKQVEGNEYTENEKFVFTLTPLEHNLNSATNNVVDTDLTQPIEKNETAAWTIAYDEPGTYYYTIQETEGSANGMHYDTKTYYAKVVVEYDGEQENKALKTTVTYGDSQQAEDSSLVVTNNYTMATFAPEVQKIVKGDNVPEGVEYSFTLTEMTTDDTPYSETVTIADGGVVAFSEITYYEKGTHVYTIRENIPELEDRVPGVTYSEETIICTVTVSEGQDVGGIVASAEYSGGSGVSGNEITNTYAKPTGSVELKVTKELTGNAYGGPDAYTFNMAPAADDPASGTNNVTDPAAQTQTIKAGGTAEWKVDYDTVGEYHYTIQELVNAENAQTGMEYDLTAYNVVVNVTLSADKMGLDTKAAYILGEDSEGKELTVTNKYSKISFQPEIIKAVEVYVDGELALDETAPDETFTFVLEETGTNEESNHSERKTGKAGDTVTFSEFTYYEAGTHTYTIREIAPNKLEVPGEMTPGMTYFDKAITCTVEVVRDEDGTLSLTAEYAGGDGEAKNTITNKYEKPRTEAEIQVTKAMTGNVYEGTDEFEFVLTKLTQFNNELIEEQVFPIKVGDTASWKFEYDLPGEYYYMINEKNLGEAGVDYDPQGYLVKVVTAYTNDLMDMEATVTYGLSPQDQQEIEEGLTVTNKYSKIVFKPAIGKIVDVLVEGEAAPEETFSFTLTDGADYVSTAECEDGGTAMFEEIIHHEPGTYVYTITEDKPALEDRTPGMAYSDQEITYTVVVVKNEETGELTIESETYTGGDGDEGSTITNTYEKPKGEAEVEVLKAMTGSDYDGENEFTFKLTKHVPQTGDEDPETGDATEGEAGDGTVDAVNDETGDGTEGETGGGDDNMIGDETVEMPVPDTDVIVSDEEQTIGVDETALWQIAYSDPGTYYYEIAEIAGEEPGMIYDENTYYAKVVVAYSEDLMSLVTEVTYGAEADETADETLTITNEFITVEYVPEVRKVLLGENPPDETFCFELTDGEDYVDTASCRGGETAQFAPITYYEAGEYVYTIRELKPETPVKGMSYSDEVVTLTVTVTRDEEDNSLEITATEYTLDGTITNTYKKPEPGYEFKFSFTKKWEGPAGTGIDWTMYDADGNVVPKKFNKYVISENEWYYEAWFVADEGYYIVENVPEGYSPIYVNTGEHADVGDRLYNGGTLINYALPQTGDNSSMHIWLAALAMSMIGLAGIAVRTAKRRKAQ